MRSRPQFAIAASLALVLAVACGKSAPNTAPTTPEQRTVHTLEIVRKIGVVVEQAQVWEIELYRAGTIKELTEPLHQDIQKGFAIAATSVTEALRELPAVLTPDDSRKLLARISDALLAITTRLQITSAENLRRLALLIDTGKMLLGEATAQ